MRTKLITWSTALAVIIVLSASVLYPYGAPPAKTGSPGDGANCTDCHGGTATTTPGLITSNIPAGGYVPGTTYQITATNPITGSGEMGFEVSPQNASGTLLGTLIAGAGTQLVGVNKYVTHQSANTTTNTWTFGWVAPASGTGQVTFYGAFARRKPGPVVTSTLTVQEVAGLPAGAGPITGPLTVCKNYTETYVISPIAGATGYTWSVPAGATIASGQGTTSVSVAFGSSAASGNISVFGSNTVGNGAPSQIAITVITVPADPAMPNGPSNVNVQNTTTTNYTTTGISASFVWQVLPANAGTIAGITSSATVTWNPAFQGLAEVRVRGINSCGESNWSLSRIVTVINTTGFNDIASAIKIFTQPGGYITFQMNTDVSQAKVTILDLTGKVIYSTSIPGKGSPQLDKNLHTGVYLVVVEAGKSAVKKKIFLN